MDVPAVAPSMEDGRMIDVASIADQYADAGYSDFVEAADNAVLYRDYFHFAFIQTVKRHMGDFFRRGAERRGDRETEPAVLRVLDLGCGNGVLGRKILQLAVAQLSVAGESAAAEASRDGNSDASPAARVVVRGVDGSPPMLAEAERLRKELDNTLIGAHDGGGCSLSFTCADVTELPADLGLFDLAVSGFLVAHLASEAMLSAFFRQIFASLQPGAHTVHIVPVAHRSDVPDGHVEVVHLPRMKSPAAAAEEDGPAAASSSTARAPPPNKESHLELFDFHWRAETLRAAVEAAGLTDFSFEPADIAPASVLTHEALPVRVRLLRARKPLN